MRLFFQTAPFRRGALSRLSGFSLVEVMIAIVVLGVGLVGLTEAITTATGSGKESELQTTAALFAAGQIEKLRAESFLIEEETEGDCGSALSLYRWKQSVRETDVDGLHEVAVVIENARTGKTIYELRTLLFQPPADTSTQNREQNRRNSSQQSGGGR